MIEGSGKKFETKTITVKGEDLKVKPSKKTLSKILAAGKLGAEQRVSKIIDAIKIMIEEANPEYSEEDVEAFVVMNYASCLPQIMKIFGYSLDKKQKERIENTKMNIKVDYVLRDKNGEVKDKILDVPVEN
ncbi:MAG: hypothetical protein ACOC1X_00760 [Promethearchaeota archaeon]